MQISTSIPLQNRQPEGLTAGERQKQDRAQQRYAKNAGSAEVIDAEYIDLNRNRAVRPEKLSIPEQKQTKEDSQETVPSQEQGQLLARFQTTDLDTPPPGSYISIYA